MSTLRVDNVSNSAGTSTAPILDVTNGSARAWVNFNGVGTVSIRAQYNVSSITDNGVGDYTVNFTTAMPNVNYAPVFGVTHTASGGSANSNSSVVVKEGIAPTVSALRIQSGTPSNSAATDLTMISVSILGAP